MGAEAQQVERTIERLCVDIRAIQKRASDTRGRLERGQASTGITGLIEIENRCRDALAAVESACGRVFAEGDVERASA